MYKTVYDRFVKYLQLMSEPIETHLGTKAVTLYRDPHQVCKLVGLTKAELRRQKMKLMMETSND